MKLLTPTKNNLTQWGRNKRKLFLKLFFGVEGLEFNEEKFS